MVIPAASVARRVRHRAGDAEAERLLQHLIVPQRLVVGVQEEMRVPLDEARDERRSRERDPLGAGRRRHARLGTHRLDPLPRTTTTHPRSGRVGRAVPHGVGRQHDGAGGVGPGRLRPT